MKTNNALVVKDDSSAVPLSSGYYDEKLPTRGISSELLQSGDGPHAGANNNNEKVPPWVYPHQLFDMGPRGCACRVFGFWALELASYIYYSPV